MGCSGSKEEDLPLVVRCRERRELIRAAANHRYALAAAHISYFRSLRDVGDALRKFVDEELITNAPSSSSSSFSSPSLVLPPGSKMKRGNGGESPLHLHDDEDDNENGSHLHISDSSSEDADSEDFHHHHHGHDSDRDQNHGHHAHVHKRKGFDEDVRHLNREEEDSSPHYPRGGFNGYGGGLGNDPYMNPYPYPYPYQPRSYGEPYMDQWEPRGMAPAPVPAEPWFYSSNSSVYYMKKSAPATRTVVQQPPAEPGYGYSDSYWNSPAIYGNPSYGGNYGYFSKGSPPAMGNNEAAKAKAQKDAPPPPSPKASTWDFFNPFDGFDNGYPNYYSSGGFGYGSHSSSPDSTEVREREGIPDLEEETESEAYKDVGKGNRMKDKAKKISDENSPRYNNAPPVWKNREGSLRSVPHDRSMGSSSRAIPLSEIGESSLKSVPFHKNSEGSSRSLPSWSSEESEKPSVPVQYSRKGVKPSIVEEREGSISLSDERSSSSPEIVLKSVDESSVRKKGVSFEVEGTNSSRHDGDLSSVTILSPHGNRDLKEVVAELRDEFETASSHGKEVAVMLEVGKLPYQPSFLKVIISRIMYMINPSLSLEDPPSMQSAKLASNTMKSAKSYFEDVGRDVDAEACNLSSTLDKLYAWEKKLYKEVKDEERLRVIYEKQCKRLRTLDEVGAESSKIDATRAYIRKLVTKLDVSIKAIDAISSRIHRLRDEELQPQLAALIHGLTRMWKAMLKCHQKQFQAIMESKMRKLRANTSLQTDPASRATTNLERELRVWSARFNEWITFQKSYVESLNGWLLRCLEYEPEETPDGPVPYSPGRLGAPPVFVICNDWQQAMEAISEARVANAMNTFATSLRQLWEKQDEEGRQRLKAEYMSKDFEKGKMGIEKDKMSDETGLSVVQSDLDSMKQKMAEERIKHKDAMKLLHDAASRSLQGGLVPIFKALETFTSDALKAHEHVRLQRGSE